MTERIEGVEYGLKISTAGGADTLVRRVLFKERLNTSYSLEIECIIPQLRKEPVQGICDQLIGGDVELTLTRSLPRGGVEETICGIVISAERAASRYELELRRASGDIGRPDEALDMVFVVHVAPAFELLKEHTKGMGSWHERTYPEVLKKVLDEGLGLYGREVQDKTKQKEKIDHIVWPPGESMHDFARRLMQAAGIISYFEHKGGKEKLVLIDENNAFIEGTQYQPRSEPFRVDYTQRHNVSENLNALLGSSEMGPKKWEYDSFDPVGTPPVEIEGIKDGKGQSESETREWGELRPTEIEDPDKQHERAAELRMQRDDTNRNSVIARTTIIGMLPGRTYEIELRPGDSRPYVVEAVHAEGIGAEYGTQEDFRNEVTLVPLEMQGGGTIDIRSVEPATEKRMPGLTLAEIVAIENHPVEVDKIHRCRIKFLWDQVEGEDPTTWVSVMQQMAGLFGGTQYIPREGDRVVVAFHEGRTDRGLILGALYDEQFSPPYLGPPDNSKVLPDSSLLLGWSHSSIEPGKKPDEQGSLDRHTMMSMDVTADQEMWFFNAPYDWRRDVGNDSETNIKRDSKIKIDRHLTQDVKENQTETVGKDYTQSVKQNRTEDVGQMYKLDVGSEQKVTVKAKRTANFGELSRTVKNGTTETDEQGNRTARVMSGNYRISVSSSYSVVAASIGFAIGGGGGMGAAAGASLDLKSNALLRGPEGVEVESGSSEMKVTPSGATTQARVVEQRDEAGASTKMENGSLVVDAPRGITFRCGASEVRLSPDGVYINGKLFNVNAVNTQIETERFDVSGE